MSAPTTDPVDTYRDKRRRELLDGYNAAHAAWCRADTAARQAIRTQDSYAAAFEREGYHWPDA